MPLDMGRMDRCDPIHKLWELQRIVYQRNSGSIVNDGTTFRCKYKNRCGKPIEWVVVLPLFAFKSFWLTAHQEIVIVWKNIRSRPLRGTYSKLFTLPRISTLNVNLQRKSTWFSGFSGPNAKFVFHVSFSPPARWGLLDFMSVACLLPLLPSASPASSSSSPRPPRPTATCDPQRSLPDLNHDHPRPVFRAGPQPRPSPPSVPCRTSTTTIHAQCSLPDLNREHPRQVFPAGPHLRVSMPSVPCHTSTASIPAQCSLPDLNHDHPRAVFPAGPQPRVSTPKDMPHRVPEDMPDRYAR